jgi:tyrosinase-like protein
MRRPRRTSLLLGLTAVALLPLAGGCLADPNDPMANTESEDIVIQQGALTPTQPEIRRTLHDLSPGERLTLRDAIIAFITQPILDQHLNGHDWHGSNELFFTRHHDYTNQLENYLISNGHSGLVPVPMWDPSTSIPNEFLAVDPLVTQTPLNANPNRPSLPTGVAFGNLCVFLTGDQLGAATNGWHGGVHTAVGGAMGNIATSPGAAIFWPWHGYVDNIYHGWQWECQVLPSVIASVT